MQNSNRLQAILPITAVVTIAGMAIWLARRDSASPPVPTTASSAKQNAVPPASVEITSENLTTSLASGDEPTRQKAQQFLAHLPANKLAWLRLQMAIADNAAVKSQLEQRAGEIAEQLATNPPPISLHVKDASLADVIYKLNEELGTDLEFRNAPSPPGTYTLDVTDQPFWEVICALNAQRPFQIQAINGSSVLTVTDSSGLGPAGMSYHAISGNFFMYAYARPLPRPSTPPSFLLSYCILADPRMPVTDLAFDWGRDKPPNGVAIAPGADGRNWKLMSRGGNGEARIAARGLIGHLQPNWPDNPVTTTATLNAQAGFTTGVSVLSKEVAGIESQTPWQLALGDVSMALSEFPANESGTFQFQVTPPEKGALVTFHLLGKNGLLAWSGSADVDGLARGRISFNSPPFTLKVDLAKITHEYSATFAISNIPIPDRP